jgi:hypothetical protein
MSLDLLRRLLDLAGPVEPPPSLPGGLLAAALAAAGWAGAIAAARWQNPAWRPRAPHHPSCPAGAVANVAALRTAPLMGYGARSADAVVEATERLSHRLRGWRRPAVALPGRASGTPAAGAGRRPGPPREPFSLP